MTEEVRVVVDGFGDHSGDRWLASNTSCVLPGEDGMDRCRLCPAIGPMRQRPVRRWLRMLGNIDSAADCRGGATCRLPCRRHVRTAVETPRAEHGPV